MNFDCLPANYMMHRHTHSLTHSLAHTYIITNDKNKWNTSLHKRSAHSLYGKSKSKSEWAKMIEKENAVIEARIFISLLNTKHKTSISNTWVYLLGACATVPMLTPFFTNSFARLHIHNLFISMLFPLPLFFSLLFL